MIIDKDNIMYINWGLISDNPDKNVFLKPSQGQCMFQVLGGTEVWFWNGQEIEHKKLPKTDRILVTFYSVAEEDKIKIKDDLISYIKSGGSLTEGINIHNKWFVFAAK